MEWLVGAALLPLVVCGLMCVGGVALAVVGLRRGDTRNRKKCCEHEGTEDRTPEGSSQPA